MTALAACMACLLLTSTTHAFAPSVHSRGSLTSSRTFATSPKPTNNNNAVPDAPSSKLESLSRRDLFGSIAATSLTLTSVILSTTIASPVLAAAEDGTVAKVLVLGGTGFVGTKVVAALRDLGVSTVATSRDGRDGTVALDFSTALNVKETVQKLAQGCTAVVSCVGTIGTENDELVNGATALAAAGAKAAGVQRFVYITVAPEVKDFAKNVDFLAGYMRGKTSSRNAVLANFPGTSSTLIEPTFIYGGGSFEINPPRVASFYGKLIEGLLSSSPIRAATNIAPAGIIKIALEPPVPVEAVANAAVAGALGKGAPSILDTYDKIKQAATLV